MTHRHRLETLEEAIGAQPDDSQRCVECQGPNSYPRMLDQARIRVGAEGKLHGVDPEECRAKLAELATYSESERCPQCGGLNARGEMRRERRERGLE